ncbi:MAG: tRNA epoxyqueuosine(34) reductase QueG [Bacteroidales bacterium]|nr:tRNA epoxyqueuosine(34) reductase QueG [Bacteroidales bacterium]
MALEMGFNHCGISRATTLEQEGLRLNQWLEAGYHAGMKYMERHLRKRIDPGSLFPGAKSVISVLYSYNPPQRFTLGGHFRIATYAYGADYHRVMKDKLFRLMKWITDRWGVTGRVFVDTAPVLERAWAERAGLGWIGKNTCLIHRKTGSYHFIGEIITPLELEPDEPIGNYCGTCTRCIDACPTGALTKPYVLDAGKCISYWTIENKSGKIPEKLRERFGSWIFGCDICQEVCPWNTKIPPHEEPQFLPDKRLLSMPKDQWMQLTPEQFSSMFSDTPVARAGYAGLMRNILFVSGH